MHRVQTIESSSSPRLSRGIMLAAMVALGVTWAVSVAQEQTTPAEPSSAVQAQEPSGDQPAPITPAADPGARATERPSLTTSTAEQVPATAPSPKNPKSYGLFVLLPAFVAILLAIFTRQVVPALFVGLLVGAYMMVPCLGATDPFASQTGIIAGFRLTVEKYIFGATLDVEHGGDRMKIVIFTLMIGFMVGVIGKNGGTAGMVHVVTGKTESRRRGALTAWLAGLVVFFDDYANTMIVGPTMRSVFDKLRLSRAKLAYIVDSTAAPVASIALIGTWVGAEVGFINEGLLEVDAASAPAFLTNESGQVVNGMTAFVQSLPYRFYPILALFLVFLTALTGRDFGAMKKSESRALSKVEPPPPPPTAAHTNGASDQPPQVTPRWWLGLLPVLVLVAVTLVVLVVSGYRAPDTLAEMGKTNADGSLVWPTKDLWERASTIVGNGNAYNSILYGAFLSAITAIALTLVARAVTIRRAADAGLDGMARMFPAIVVLVLAWSLSQVQQDLQLGAIVAEQLEGMKFPVQWLPLSVFISSALISFATGSSWTTMGVLCPAVVTISVGLFTPEAGLNLVESQSLFYASIGSVLAGSVFGDHCSPISDTTVLSSIASGCPHEEHVWTQIPYAVVAAIAAMGLGDVLCSVYKQPWYYGLGAGALFLILFVLIVGRRAKADLSYAGDDPRVTQRLAQS